MAAVSSPAIAEASFVSRLITRKTVMVGILILLVVAALAILAPLIAPYSPSRLSVVNRLKPPSGIYWFGTDEFGRDVFSRTIYAGRLSLLVGASVVAFAAVFGVTLGLVAGFFRRLDTPIARIIDAMMAFPDILLAIALVAALGPSLVTVIVALGIVYTPRLARIVRASTLVIRELPYVEAARALGVPTWRIMTRHVLRNLVSPILVQGTFIFAYAMLAEAGPVVPRPRREPRGADLGHDDRCRAAIYRAGRLDDAVSRHRHHPVRSFIADGRRRLPRPSRSAPEKGSLIS